jgi:hypothetical protein
MAKQNVTYEIRAYDKASGTFKKVELQSSKTKRSVDNLNKGSKNGADDAGSAWSKTNSVLRGTALIAAGVVAVRMGYNLSKDAVMAAAQLEKYNVTLKTMLGSTSAARDRMEEYLDVAKKTPFELSQVVEAGNQLQAIGRYSRENLEMLGDLAAASGKPMEQVMNAYAKLATGQKGEAVNMFRDLLISTDDWTKATGRAKAKNGELLASTEQMIKALPKIMKEKGFFGMMASQAETTEGKLSNAKDAVFSLSASIGERLKPSVDKGISAFTKWVEITEDWVKIPTAEKIAEEQSEVNALVESIVELNSSQEIRKTLLDELQRKYPEFLGNLDKETVTAEQLRDRLKEVNDEYDRKLKKAILADVLEEASKDYQEAFKNKIRLTRLDNLNDQLGKAYGRLNKAKKGSTEYKSAEATINLLKRQIANASTTSEYGDTKAGREQRRKEYEENYERQKEVFTNIKVDIDKELEDIDKDTKNPSTKAAESTKTDQPSNVNTDNVTTPSELFSSSGSGRSVRGYGEAKNVTTHIQNLINGDIVIQTTTLTEGAAEIKRIVVQTLLDATNEIN